MAQDDPFDFDLSAEESASDDAFRVSGYVESRHQKFLTQTPWLSNRQRGQLEIKANATDWLRSFASGFVEYDPATEPYRDTIRAELIEFYTVLDGPSTDVTVGKQRIAWGTADGRSTIDRINAIDFRDPIGNARTSARRPSWAMRVEQSTDIGVFEGVWLPRGRDRRLPEPGSPWEPSGLAALREAGAAGAFDLSIENPNPHEFGFRYTNYGEGFDWGFAVFDGQTDSPILREQTPTRVRLAPQRIRTWNVNTAIGQASSTWRGEIAYTPDFPVGLGVDHNLLQFIVGWDRTFFENLYVNAQLFWDKFSGADDTYGATFAVTDKFFDDSTEAGVRGQIANEGQYTVETFADVELNDAVTLTAKVLVFGGNTGSGLFDFRENDFAEISLRYAF